MRKVFVYTLAIVALAACGGREVDPEVDGGGGTDAQTGIDAHVEIDGGEEADAQVDTDAHVETDATVETDAHVETDATVDVDAHLGTDVDGGSIDDAGGFVDAARVCMIGQVCSDSQPCPVGADFRCYGFGSSGFCAPFTPECGGFLNIMCTGGRTCIRGGGGSLGYCATPEELECICTSSAENDIPTDGCPDRFFPDGGTPPRE